MADDGASLAQLPQTPSGAAEAWELPKIGCDDLNTDYG